MVLKTERLLLRPVQAEDWQSIKEIWKDFNQSPYAQYDMPHCTEDEDVRARIARWAAYSGGMEHMFYAVCLQERIIGYVAFNIRKDGYEIGYSFHSDYHKKGYAKESHLALFRYLKERGVKRLTAGTAINNVPSVQLLESLGFKQIGTEKVSFYQDEEGNDIIFDGGIYELLL